MSTPADRFSKVAAYAADPAVPLAARLEACRQLANEVGDPRVDVLLHVLVSTDSPELRFEAVYDLGQLHDARAFEPLCRIIRDEKEAPALRGLAAELISNFSGVDAVPVLLEALAAPHAIIRFDAAWSLRALADERAREALAACIDDAATPYARERSIGEVAREALARLAPAKRAPAKRSPAKRSPAKRSPAKRPAVKRARKRARR